MRLNFLSSCVNVDETEKVEITFQKLKKIEKQKKLEEIARNEKNLSKPVEEEKKIEGNTEKNEESNLTSNDEKKNVSKEHVEQTINDYFDKAASGDNKNSEQENTELNDQEEKQKKRRTHCYAYIFKKLELNKN